MGMYDDKEKLTHLALEISLQKDEFDEDHEFHNKLREQFKHPLLAGQAKLVKYDIKSKLYTVELHWDSWCKAIGKAIGEMVLPIERDAAKQLYEREDRYPVYLVLAVDNGNLKVRLPDVTIGVAAVKLHSPDKDFGMRWHWSCRDTMRKPRYRLCVRD